jgi:hypothetical protein
MSADPDNDWAPFAFDKASSLCTCESHASDFCSHYPGPIFAGEPGGTPFDVYSDASSCASDLDLGPPDLKRGRPYADLGDLSCGRPYNDPGDLSCGRPYIDPGNLSCRRPCDDSADLSCDQPDDDLVDPRPALRRRLATPLADVDLALHDRKRRRPPADHDDPRPPGRRRLALTCDPPPRCEPGSPPLRSQGGGGQGVSSASRAHPADFFPP